MRIQNVVAKASHNQAIWNVILFVFRQVLRGVSQLTRTATVFTNQPLVLKNVPIPSLAIIHVNNGIVGVLHRPLLDPRLDLFLSSKLQHLLDLSRRTDTTTSDLDSTHEQRKSIDVRQLALVWRTDLNEVAKGLEHSQVAIEGHLSARDSTDDEVQCAGVMLSPVLVFIGGDVSVGTELEYVVALFSLATDSYDFVCAESFGEEDGEMAQTANSDNSNGFSGTTAESFQW